MNLKLTPIEKNGQRVLTTAQIAEAYGTTERRISENFNANKERYIEGKHYYCLTGDALKEFKNSEYGKTVVASNLNKLYIWTEKGALLHAKSLNTDKAWEVYDFLVESYYKKKELPQLTGDALIAQALIEAKNMLDKERADNLKLTEKIESDKPLVLFANSVTASKNSILVGEMAKILKQNGVKDMGQNRFFAWLRNNGYLIKRQGTDYNMPTQHSMELDLFEIKETSITHADGHISTNKTPKITGKGQVYFINKFLGDYEITETERGD